MTARSLGRLWRDCGALESIPDEARPPGLSSCSGEHSSLVFGPLQDCQNHRGL